MTVLLVEPFYGGSHRQWADGLREHCESPIELITHPDANWRWRMEGSAVTLVAQLSRWCKSNGRPEAVVFSDMTDVAALLGLQRDALAGVPTGLYMHENQLTYDTERGSLDTGLVMRNWTSMCAVDAVWFNSQFHLDSWFAAIRDFLGRRPDAKHGHLIDDVRAKSSVLPVGLDLGGLLDAKRAAPSERTQVIWNQRWEFDKRPEVVFEALAEMASDGFDLEVIVAGDSEAVGEVAKQKTLEPLGDRIVSVGELSRADYTAALLSSDIVVSAATHEFFGIAPVEAIAAGVIPVLPDRLNYPELVPTQLHAEFLYGNGDPLQDDVASAVRNAIGNLDTLREHQPALRRHVAKYDWSNLSREYDSQLAQLIHR